MAAWSTDGMQPWVVVLLLGESLSFLAGVQGNAKAGELTAAAEAATLGIPSHDHSPGPEGGQPDKRSSHDWIARDWVGAWTAQPDDAALAAHFEPIATALTQGESAILSEPVTSSRKHAGTGGSCWNHEAKSPAVMGSSPTRDVIIG